MRPRDCVRLLVVGVCAGVLPACMFGPGRRAADAANMIQADVPADAPVSRSANWSPYGAIAMPDRTNAPGAGSQIVIERSSPSELPQRPARFESPVAQAPPANAIFIPTAARTETRTETPAIVIPPRSEVAKTAYTPAVPPGTPALVSALQCFLDKQPQAALPHLNRYDAENQELLLNLLPLTARMSEGPIGKADPQEIAVMIDQLQGVITALQPHAALVMDKACFCRQVKKFGIYEALGDRPTFHQGEIVELYCEIRNVVSEPYKSQRGEFRTHLQSALQIRNGTGFVMQNKSERVDVSHTPQRDYFLHYTFGITEKMLPGAYTATIEVADVPTGRRVSRKLEFLVRAE